MDCDIEFFKRWIEYQFEDWMSWDNYGEWQFDHVIPCSSFDFSDKKAQMKCFNWRNIQPLEKFKNNSKNNKILDDLILKHSLKVEEYMSLNLNPLKEDEGSETR